MEATTEMDPIHIRPSAGCVASRPLLRNVSHSQRALCRLSHVLETDFVNEALLLGDFNQHDYL